MPVTPSSRPSITAAPMFEIRRPLPEKAVESAVTSGQFALVEQTFFNTPVKFEDFAEFERLILGVTHTRIELSAEVLEEVKRRFARHVTAEGVRFAQPIRVDLLRRPH